MIEVDFSKQKGIFGGFIGGGDGEGGRKTRNDIAGGDAIFVSFTGLVVTESGGERLGIEFAIDPKAKVNGTSQSVSGPSAGQIGAMVSRSGAWSKIRKIAVVIVFEDLDLPVFHLTIESGTVGALERRKIGGQAQTDKGDFAGRIASYHAEGNLGKVDHNLLCLGGAGNVGDCEFPFVGLKDAIAIPVDPDAQFCQIPGLVGARDHELVGFPLEENQR